MSLNTSQSLSPSNIVVYRREASAGARLLAEQLNGRRVRDLTRRPLRPNELLIPWGEYVPNFTGRTLNNVPFQSKFKDALTLKQAGVPTIEVSQTQPRLANGPTPSDPAGGLFLTARSLAEILADTEDWSRSQPFIDGIKQQIDSLVAFQTALVSPPPTASLGGPDPSWFGRLNNHVGGEDILNPPASPDYWAKKDEFATEYRVHSFLGKSIRAGKKVIRDGVPTHPWVRSWNGGWKISYDGTTVKQRHRDLAHQAVKALGLDFGAVDIGERADGSLVVLEVNRAPGLEGGTIDAYAKHIEGWLAGTLSNANTQGN
jgi:hypothetical protein